jgi:hypothetical protein
VADAPWTISPSERLVPLSQKLVLLRAGRQQQEEKLQQLARRVTLVLEELRAVEHKRSALGEAVTRAKGPLSRRESPG